MKLSYVIVTRNRRSTLLGTLARLCAVTGLPWPNWEVFVVDNASEDDTVGAVGKRFPGVHLIRLAENEGVPARNYALPLATGRYVCFLDDDSYPTEGAISRIIGHLDRHPKTAAVVARVVLPDGTAEAPALPGVTIGGASVVRRSVLAEVGGFAPEFFRQAEEYDLSFRIWRAGYRIERFEDVYFGHDKAPGGRSSEVTSRMDLRNNLILVERYLPRDLRRAYRHDFIRRYAALARHAGHDDVIGDVLREARVWGRRESAVGRKTLQPDAVEALFDLDRQAAAVAEWAKARHVRRVVLADLSKNLYATYQACRRAGLAVECVADNHPAFAGQRYRCLPVLPDAEARSRPADGVICSTISPALVDRRMAELLAAYDLPVLRLWHPKLLHSPAERVVA